MTKHQLLWDCFLTEQMSASELQAHMSADRDFADFVAGIPKPSGRAAPTQEKVMLKPYEM